MSTGFIDLYQLHRFDPSVPMEEMLAERHELLKAGRARYPGASKLLHLEQLAGAALEIDLSADECAYLEAPYQPHPVLGHT